MDISIVISTSW